MEACRMARLREARGGGVRLPRMASRAAVFQSVTTSARAEAAPNTVRMIKLRRVCLFMVSLLFVISVRAACQASLLPGQRPKSTHPSQQPGCLWSVLARLAPPARSKCAGWQCRQRLHRNHQEAAALFLFCGSGLTTHETGHLPTRGDESAGRRGELPEGSDGAADHQSRIQPSNRNPPALAATLENRFAQLHLVVPVLGGGEEHGRFPAAGDVLVDGAVMHLVTVGKALGMAARIIGEAGHILNESGGGALENLVRLVAPAEENFVRLRKIPARAAFRPVDADRQAALPPGGDLRDAGIGMDAVDEAVLGLA